MTDQEKFAEIMASTMKAMEGKLVSDIIDINPVLDDMLRVYGPLKPTPWYKRLTIRFGNWLIRVGLWLGGSYDY